MLEIYTYEEGDVTVESRSGQFGMSYTAESTSEKSLQEWKDYMKRTYPYNGYSSYFSDPKPSEKEGFYIATGRRAHHCD